MVARRPTGDCPKSVRNAGSNLSRIGAASRTRALSNANAFVIQWSARSLLTNQGLVRGRDSPPAAKQGCRGLGSGCHPDRTIDPYRPLGTGPMVPPSTNLALAVVLRRSSLPRRMLFTRRTARRTMESASRPSSIRATSQHGRLLGCPEPCGERAIPGMNQIPPSRIPHRLENAGKFSPAVWHRPKISRNPPQMPSPGERAARTNARTDSTTANLTK